jgi:hypothetical protein
MSNGKRLLEWKSKTKWEELTKNYMELLDIEQGWRTFFGSSAKFTN